MIRGFGLLVGGLLSTLALPAVAEQDYLSSQGKLSDEAFYKMVACAAPQGADCKMPLVRWPNEVAQSLRIGITRIDAGFPKSKVTLAEQAFEGAIAEINGLDANITLTRDDGIPTIQVMLLDVPEKAVLSGTGIPGLDGNWMDAAYVHIWWNGEHELIRGVIIISPSVERSALRSVVLEEMVQSLGLLTDIDNPYYKGGSIFDQHSNAVTRLKDQDAMAVRRHYETQ